MSGLVGWWPLCDDSGNATDYSGQGNHGSVTGTTRRVAGKGGLTAYSFDGTDDYVNVGHSTVLQPKLGGFTASAWVKTDPMVDYINSNKFPRLFVKTPSAQFNDTNGWQIAMSAGHSHVAIGDGTTDNAGQASGKRIDDGKWHHCLFTWDGDTIELFVDGVSQDVTPWSGTIATTNTASIGASNTPNHHFRGSIGPCRVYNRVLRPSEIRTLYEWGNGDYAQPPTDGVAYYPLDGDATDYWGTNDGTVNGATPTTGIRSQAYSFDGTDDDISFSNPPPITGSMTVSMWARYDTANTNHTINNYGGGTGTQHFILGLGAASSAGYPSFFIDDGSTSVAAFQPTVVTTGVWYHLVGVYDDTSKDAKIYINGTLAAKSSFGGTTPNWQERPMFFGYSPYGGSRTDGVIDDVRIYDRALSQAEISALYRWGTRGRDMRQLVVTA